MTTSLLQTDLATFYTFHGRTAPLPYEISLLIIDYAESYMSLPGQLGVTYPPVARVCKTLREIYLAQKSRFNFDLQNPPVPLIKEALNFPDLRSLAQYFTNGPGRRDTKALKGQYLTDITHIRIVYRDDWAVPNWEYTVRYAYEAFELLVNNLDRMNLRWLQIHVPSSPTPFGIDAPGIWSLLQVRTLQDFILSCRRGEIDPAVRQVLQRRLRWGTYHHWAPTGLENPGPGDWKARINPHTPGSKTQKQHAYLAMRYKFLHHRLTVDARRRENRKARDQRYGLRNQARAQRRRQVIRQAGIRERALKRHCIVEPKETTVDFL
jgi:hypothetical protein